MNASSLNITISSSGSACGLVLNVFVTHLPVLQKLAHGRSKIKDCF